MQLVEENYWSLIINILVQKYFADLTTTCVFWSREFDFDLTTSFDSRVVYLQINSLDINEAFHKDIYDYRARELRDNENGVTYSDLVKKLIAAIEHTHCEGFLAFQDDIPKFAEAFVKASVYSIWRSMNNRFLFAYSKDLKKKDYFEGVLFKNQPYILLIESEYLNSSIFYLKTNKFVGSRLENPQDLIHLSTFYAQNLSFIPDVDLYSSSKLENLMGREIVIGAFDYRPFVAVDYKRLPLYTDVAEDNPQHLVHVDGTEVKICHVFCEKYNCVVQFDSSEKEEWGLAFSNYSGYGLIDMIIKGKIDVAMSAMYAVHTDYAVIDMTTFMGRSGVTCLVPKASSLVSWNLPLKPFKLTLWLAIFASLFLETIVLFITRKFEQNLSNSPDTWWSSLQFGYITTLKLFINQNSHYLVHSHTVRVFLFACYTLDTILSSVYGGGLSAVLTLPTFAESPDSVERLYKFNLTWTASSLAWLETINSTDVNKDPIYQHLVENFEVNSFDDMTSKAKTENMAFVIERLSFGHFGGGDYITPQALQRLKLMIDDIYSQYTVAMVSRLWPHLKKYNDLILIWHSSGLDKYWEWKMTAEYLNVNEQNQMEASKYNTYNIGPEKLNLENFAGLVILWIAGMFLSMVVFVGELLWLRWEQRTKGRKMKARDDVKIVWS